MALSRDGQRRLPRALCNLDMAGGHNNPKCQKTVKRRVDLKETTPLHLTGVPIPRLLGPGQAPHWGPICLLTPSSRLCSRCSSTWHAPSFLSTCPSIPPPSPAGLPILMRWASCNPGVYLFTSTHASSHPFIQLLRQILLGTSCRRAACQVWVGTVLPTPAESWQSPLPLSSPRAGAGYPVDVK